MNPYKAIKLHSIIIPSKGTKMNTWVFINGSFLDAEHFEEVARSPEMTLNTEIHLIDIRNYGKSPKTATMFYEEIIMDIRLYIDSHSLTELCILGASFGAVIAIQLALSPKTNRGIKALVLSDSGPFPYYNLKKYPPVRYFFKKVI